ncbi:alpha- -mannosyltransferase [Vairimorpha apis BRL 01]|uniref:Alpha--mannosyltransferase n=2 Tax=Vairimorpha apis BRL 01 TaxID=1037528 RepID=T0L0C7_9MICR|nr:alpha- -mannosyltransferase [Vairimorpha apis BRL 01]
MFNNKFRYPYVMLNDDHFTDEFKSNIKKIVSTDIKFGKLTNTEFGIPSHIDMTKVQNNINILKSQNIIYGDSIPYRKMCRFFSGYFFRHPLVLKYRYYWRIEPGVKFLCKINYDPFEFLRNNEKEYGFVITIKEYMETIPSLYKETLNFIINNKKLVGNPKINNFILNKDYTYNGCHFWSNFEIASFDFFRSDVYLDYFKYLDMSGGFFYERWGDAPVHTLAASLFLEKKLIHFFDDIGYEHPPYSHCPSSPSRLVDCECRPKDSVDFMEISCLKQWLSDVLEST